MEASSPLRDFVSFTDDLRARVPYNHIDTGSFLLDHVLRVNLGWPDGLGEGSSLCEEWSRSGPSSAV